MTKNSKQLTFDNLPKTTQREAVKLPKQIIVTQIDTSTRDDELALKIAFKLAPSKAAFSKVKSDLSFDNQLVNSVVIRIPQGALASDECEYVAVLDMSGIVAGFYTIKVEMYELWGSNEKLCQTTEEKSFDYVPQTRQSRLVRGPSVKSVAGADLVVASGAEKIIFEEIEKTIKKEQLSKRDNW